MVIFVPSPSLQLTKSTSNKDEQCKVIDYKTLGFLAEKLNYEID